MAGPGQKMGKGNELIVYETGEQQNTNKPADE